MPRIVDALERESQTVDLEPGDFERLLGRRERKQRNRRIRAGVVGVIVAVATAAALARSMSSEHVPADQPKPLGAGEVLLAGRSLGARDPDSGGTRTIVDDGSLPPAHGEDITGAAWSPDRQWVAFRRGSGSQAGELWVADTVGGAPRRIATDVGWSPWVWSPAGNQLVFVLGRDVTLIDAVTGRETDLGTVVGAKDSEGYAVHELVWSPDGTRIAYDGGLGSGSIYAIDVKSGEHSLLMRPPTGTGAIANIDWSPDGDNLAITYEDASGVGPGALYLAKADGSNLRFVDRIETEGWPVWEPGMSVSTAWSPDGNRLAYTISSVPAAHREQQVWIVSTDGSAPSLFVSDWGGPVWSPDGTQIALSAEHGAGTPNVRVDRVVVKADGTGDQQEIDQFTYQSWDGGWFFCFCYG